MYTTYQSSSGVYLAKLVPTVLHYPYEITQGITTAYGKHSRLQGRSYKSGSNIEPLSTAPNTTPNSSVLG